jgi:hypothetical protein
MSKRGSGEADGGYEKPWNEWSNGLKLSNLKFLRRLGFSLEKTVMIIRNH